MKYLFYIILPVFIVSCDLFQTRPPEGPDQTKSNYTPPDQAKILIQNMINSFFDKNTDNYRKSFESISGLTNNNFTFIPSSSAQIAYQGIWDNWDVQSETQYFNSIKNTVPDELPMRLSLSTKDESLSILGDSARYTSYYTISIPQINSESLFYEGNVEFTMVRDSRQIWIINYWKDNAIGDSPSWSDLKGSYAN
jgi:hypothetical protein